MVQSRCSNICAERSVLKDLFSKIYDSRRPLISLATGHC